MQTKYLFIAPQKSLGLLRKLVGLVITVAVVAIALMFSAVLLVVIAIVGTLAGVYLWWKTRELRKHMRDFSRQGMAREAQVGNDEVFEGEVIRVVIPENKRD